MTSATPGRGQKSSPVRALLPGTVVRLHLTALIVVPGCLAAGGFELSRALSGNSLSWVYVFEWPFFAVFCVHLWWRLWHEERAAGPTAPVAGEPALVSPAAPATAVADADADPQLQAWQEYLARLHAEHPPGGPPARAA